MRKILAGALIIAALVVAGCAKGGDHPAGDAPPAYDPNPAVTDVASLAELAAALAPHVGITGDLTYSTNNGLIEVVPLGISKATGVAEILRPLGISSEDVVTFGDMPNDIPMLSWAGLGVAMGNAHPEALAAADEVTTTNSDDGVARVLERWWL